MRILFITETTPYPPVSGDGLRIYNLMRRVAQHHKVWLAFAVRDTSLFEDISHLLTFCEGMITAERKWRPRNEHLPVMFRYLLAGIPLELELYYSDELAQKIRDAAHDVQFDVVQIEHSHMALYRELFADDSHCKSVLTLHNVVFEQHARIHRISTHYESLLGRARSWLYGQMMRRWEPQFAARFDRCVMMSDVDRDLLLQANPLVKTTVIPNGVDTRLYQPLPCDTAPHSLIFVGSMHYPPCEDAMLYFVADILPLIRREMPDIELWIVGQHPSEAIRQLEGNGIHVTGRVPEVLPYYQHSAVAIVPLRVGGGTRLKILEAMALGRPVVSTSIGCEGLAVEHERDLLIADEPAIFAEQTLRLLKDRDLYARLRDNGRQLVVSRYDWDAIAPKLLQVYDEIT